MQTKSKITAAAALAALSVPTAAVAHDADKPGDDRRSESRSSEHRSKQGSERTRSGTGEKSRGERSGDRRGKHDGWNRKSRAFVIAGVDAAGVTVTDGKLTGEITLDPIAASKGARRLLDLTKAEIRGEDTVKFGTTGDEVTVRYRGLESTDAIQPTDRVTVFGKINRADGTLDIRFIKVKRPSAEPTAEAKAEAKASRSAKKH